MTSEPEGFSTKAIHAGQSPLQWSHRAVIPPLVLSTTFQQDGPAEFKVSSNYMNNSLKFISLTLPIFYSTNQCQS